jgi:hypothetical protein
VAFFEFALFYGGSKPPLSASPLVNTYLCIINDRKDIGRLVEKLMTERKKKETKVSDITGSWDITDEEAEEIKASIGQVWETWKPQKQSSTN